MGQIVSQPARRSGGLTGPDRFSRFTRQIPWPVVWFTIDRLSESPLGRRLLTRIDRNLPTYIAAMQRICTALGWPREQTEREISRLYRNSVLQSCLLCRSALLPREQLAEEFRVEGYEHLVAERAAGRPVIFAGTHFGVNRLFPVWLARQGIELLSLEGGDRMKKLAIPVPETLSTFELTSGFPAQATLAALRKLQAGGCINITAERMKGFDQQSSQRDWPGISMQFLLGLPNLSLGSGASILPYFCTLQHRGRVRVEIKPPIRPPTEVARVGTPAREQQVERLVDEFDKVFRAEVERTPGNLRTIDRKPPG
jgi:lauroyl/myristoyl acyltransferase